jgi:hypothetical protein
LGEEGRNDPNIVCKYEFKKSNNNPFIEACPAKTRKVTDTPVKGREESGEEITIIEKRSLTRTELQQYRKNLPREERRMQPT